MRESVCGCIVCTDETQNVETLKTKIMTRVIALRDGVSQGNSIVEESIQVVQKMFISKYGGRLDLYGNVICKMKNSKWEFQLKSLKK